MFTKVNKACFDKKVSGLVTVGWQKNVPTLHTPLVQMVSQLETMPEEMQAQLMPAIMQTVQQFM